MKKLDYKETYAKHVAFIEARPALKRILHPASHALTTLYFVFYAWLLYTGFKQNYPANDLISIIGAPVLCLLVVTILRYAVARPRPYAEDGANIQPIAKKKDGVNNSFPSRHVACAFVIATVLLPFATGIALALLATAVMLAYTRFALGLHYISDLIGGAVIGVLCGVPVFI